MRACVCMTYRLHASSSITHGRNQHMGCREPGKKTCVFIHLACIHLYVCFGSVWMRVFTQLSIPFRSLLCFEVSHSFPLRQNGYPVKGNYIGVSLRCYKLEVGMGRIFLCEPDRCLTDQCPNPT